MIGKDSGIRSKYEEIKPGLVEERAIVAVARVLGCLIRRTLLNQVPYEIDFQKAA